MAGRGRPPSVAALQQQVQQQTRENAGLQQRNDALAAEVEDLKSGEAAVEERARSELGMIKPGETFYRVVEADSADRPTARTRPTATPAGDAGDSRRRERHAAIVGGHARRRPRHALRRRHAQAVPGSRAASR